MRTDVAVQACVDVVKAGPLADVAVRVHDPADAMLASAELRLEHHAVVFLANGVNPLLELGLGRISHRVRDAKLLPILLECLWNKRHQLLPHVLLFFADHASWDSGHNFFQLFVDYLSQRNLLLFLRRRLSLGWFGFLLLRLFRVFLFR